MNIVVFGVGGVGGYFGGRLAQAGFRVTCVARGKHGNAIKNNGLQVKSILGDFKVYPEVTHDVSTIKDPDLILLGVKSWQILDVASQIEPILTNNTMVLPLQNGADNADKLRSVIDHKHVLAGFCKIVAKIDSPGVIDHFAFEPEIVFGEYDNTMTERAKDLKIIFDASGIKNEISKDIHLDIWKKFLFIATISGIGALTRVVFGDMRNDKHIRDLILQTAKEIVLVANAKGIALNEEHIQLVMQIVDNLNEETTASMQRDIMNGRPSELDNFNGYIVNQGREFRIETPVNSFTYHCLLPQERKARGLS